MSLIVRAGRACVQGAKTAAREAIKNRALPAAINAIRTAHIPHASSYSLATRSCFPSYPKRWVGSLAKTPVSEIKEVSSRDQLLAQVLNCDDMDLLDDVLSRVFTKIKRTIQSNYEIEIPKLVWDEVYRKSRDCQAEIIVPYLQRVILNEILKHHSADEALDMISQNKGVRFKTLFQLDSPTIVGECEELVEDYLVNVRWLKDAELSLKTNWGYELSF